MARIARHLKHPMSLWIGDWMDTRTDLDDKAVAQFVGVSDSAVRVWASQRRDAAKPRLPSPDNLAKLEELFGEPAPSGPTSGDLGAVVEAIERQTKALTTRGPQGGYGPPSEGGGSDAATSTLTVVLREVFAEQAKQLAEITRELQAARRDAAKQRKALAEILARIEARLEPAPTPASNGAVTPDPLLTHG